jgi:hypothetical protein
MIRTVAGTEIRNVACPLWALLNSSASWPGSPGQFNLVQSAACAIVAHLAYCAIGADEREQRNRAKIVPCRVYQTLIMEDDFDFPAVMAGMDFQDVGIIRAGYFVAIIIPVGEKLFIGVRGTQFAHDWLINSKIAKSRDEVSGDRFHTGYLREAQALDVALRELLQTRYASVLAKPNAAIYVGGHSLGGAVGALINRWEAISGCYLFGAPRIGNARRVGRNYEPFAMRRYLDIVPHCPPSTFGYADFANQLKPSGERFESADSLELYFFAIWMAQISLRQFPVNHSMERYRLEVLQTVRQDPDFDRLLAKCPDIEP